MDLTGRAPGYREIAIRCPGCAGSMAIEAVGEADVDICTACGGMWVDWFDGEVRQVAASVLAREGSRPPPPPASLRNETVATGACPRCTCQLAVERYTVRTETTDLLRCEQCAGVFVPRTSAEVLSTLPPDEQAPRSSTEAAAILEPLPWQKFVMLVKRLVGVS